MKKIILLQISVLLILISTFVFANTTENEKESHVNLTRTEKQKGLFSKMFTNMVVKQRIAPKRRKILATPSDYGMDYASIDIMSTDGIKLSAWKVTVKNWR